MNQVGIHCSVHLTLEWLTYAHHWSAHTVQQVACSPGVLHTPTKPWGASYTPVSRGPVHLTLHCRTTAQYNTPTARHFYNSACDQSFGHSPGYCRAVAVLRMRVCGFLCDQSLAPSPGYCLAASIQAHTPATGPPPAASSMQQSRAWGGEEEKPVGVSTADANCMCAVVCSAPPPPDQSPCSSPEP